MGTFQRSVSVAAVPAAERLGSTVHSIRSRFAARLNSGVRPQMTESRKPLQEALVVVERNGVHQIEIREVLREGDACFVVFGRSDGSHVCVPVDSSKLKETMNGQVPADLIYRGGALVAPQQEV